MCGKKVLLEAYFTMNIWFYFSIKLTKSNQNKIISNYGCDLF